MLMPTRMGRRASLAAAAATAVAVTAMFSGTTLAGASPATPQAYHPPAIKHVWVIQLENESFGDTFGDTSYPYLSKTLPGMGALLKNYYSIGHHSLDNYIAEISGEAPDYDTQNDCPILVPFPSKAAVNSTYHQVEGDGCIYPASVQTLGNQLSARGLNC